MKHERNFDGINVTWRNQPFIGPIGRLVVRPGSTFYEIAAAIPELPERFFTDGYMMVNDRDVARGIWHIARPKLIPGVDMVVTLHLPMGKGSGGGGGGGGSGGGGKNIFATIATIAVLITAAAVSGGALGFGAVGFLSAGAVNAAAGAAIAVGGSLAVAALSPPPSFASTAASTSSAGQLTGDGGSGPSGVNSSLGTASLGGNILSLGAPMPRVIGTKRVFPPFLSDPLVEVRGDDEYVEAIYGLVEGHQLADIRLDNTPIVDIAEAQFEVQEGLPGGAKVTLVRRQSKTVTPQIELSKHELLKTTASQLYLENQVHPDASTPQWHRLVTFTAPHEIWVNALFSEGLVVSDVPTTFMSVPIRMRIRPRGATDWVYLPEVHVTNLTGGGFQKSLKIIWGTAPAGLPTPATAAAVSAAFKDVYAEFLPVTLISDFTSAGPAATDLVTDTIAADCTAKNPASAAAYIGMQFANPTVITKSRIFSSNDFGFLTTGTATALTINLRASQTLPVSGSDGTLLGTTGPFTDVNASTMKEIISNDGETQWVYSWFELICTSGTATFAVAEIVPITYSANDHFSAGALNDYYDEFTVATTNVRNVSLYKDRVEFFLTEAVCAQGICEIEIKRGQAFVYGAFNLGTYVIDPGGRRDFFRYYNDSGYRLLFDQAQLRDKIIISRVSYIWNEHPIAKGDFAHIAIRVHNRAAGKLSVLASGYVNDYDSDSGTWSTPTISSNPATNFRAILSGPLCTTPVPLDLVEDAEIITWRQDCIDNNYTANFVMEGKTQKDGLNLCAAAGYARPRESETWGVMRDKDRSGDTPAQIISPRNGKDYKFRKVFGSLPSGLRVRYDDADLDGVEQEVIVYDPEGDSSDARLEDFRNDAADNEEEAVARALFDMAQARKRLAFHSFDMDGENIVFRRGDLVGFQHDVIAVQAGFARVESIGVSGGNVVELTLDAAIPLPRTDAFSATAPAWSSYSSAFAAPRTGITLRLRDGTLITKEITGDGEQNRVVSFVTPFADPGSILAPDCLGVSGKLGQEYRRLIVLGINPTKQLNATVTAVDEVPELWAIAPENDVLKTNTSMIVRGTLRQAVAAKLSATASLRGVTT